jgi:hypothetical protein
MSPVINKPTCISWQVLLHCCYSCAASFASSCQLWALRDSTVSTYLLQVGTDFWLNQPYDMKFDAYGNLFIADSGEHAVDEYCASNVPAQPCLLVLVVASILSG